MATWNLVKVKIEPMCPLCLSRGEEDESQVNGGQQLSSVATCTDLHIRGFSGASHVLVPASCGSVVCI